MPFCEDFGSFLRELVVEPVTWYGQLRSPSRIGRQGLQAGV